MAQGTSISQIKLTERSLLRRSAISKASLPAAAQLSNFGPFEPLPKLWQFFGYSFGMGRGECKAKHSYTVAMNLKKLDARLHQATWSFFAGNMDCRISWMIYRGLWILGFTFTIIHTEQFIMFMCFGLFWINVSICFHPLYLVVLSKPAPAACQLVQLVLFRLVRQEPTWIRTRAFVRWDSLGQGSRQSRAAEPCLAAWPGSEERDNSGAAGALACAL